MTLAQERERVADLVTRARDGDQAAFGALVRIHQHRVFTLAVRLVGNRELAADVAQEAFVRAWRGMPRFRADSSFSTWLYRITVNTAWTARRRARRAATVPLDEGPEVADRGATPEREVARRELRGQLQDALAALRPAERTIVVMKDVYGWSHAQIAESLGVSVSVTKVRLHRARVRLRRLLDEARR